jgi:hypothetical protein
MVSHPKPPYKLNEILQYSDTGILVHALTGKRKIKSPRGVLGLLRLQHVHWSEAEVCLVITSIIEPRPKGHIRPTVNSTCH